MLVRTLSVLLLAVVLAQATPLPRGQRQFGFFNPWGDSGTDYDESAEDSGSKADYPDYTNIGSVLQGMQAMMTRMRQQLAQAMNRFPQVPLPNKPFSPSDAGFDGTKPSNTSSITKVINGHKVTVNETTYSSGDEGGNSHHVFRIKTVDISPHKEEAGESIEVTDKEESKEVSNESTVKPTSGSSEDNEIPQKREGKILHESEWEDDIPEDQFTTTTPPSKTPWPQIYYKWASVPKFASKWRKYAASPKSFQEERNYNPDVEIIHDGPIKPIDLSSDLRVNQILSERANAGALILPDPDSEFIELKDGKFVPSIQMA